MPIYLQQGRHFSENEMKATTSVLFIFGIGGGLIAGIVNDWLVKKKGLKFGRKLLGFLSMSTMSLLFIIAATTTRNTIVSIAFIACYPFIPVYGITALSTCVDIGGNNACTIAGFINFAGQIGAFFLAIFFGKIVDVTNNYNAPLFVIISVLIAGAFLWLGVNAEKKSINDLKDFEQIISLTPVLAVK
jgi:sugar phosphate permease